MADYAILRVEKLKTKSEVWRSLAHCFRAQETHNADPSRLHDNSHFCATNVGDAMVALEAKLPVKLRKNGVITLEYLITGSPEAMAAKSKEEQDAYLRDAYAWLQRRHGPDNIFVGTIHRDETTAHLSAFVVPLDARHRMNARGFTGGVEMLAVMQTDFAARVGEKHGLKRGEEKSGARHTSIREYYRSIAKAERGSASAENILSTQNDVGIMQRTTGNISQEIIDAVHDNAALTAENQRLRQENENLKRSVAVRAKEASKAKAATVRDIRLDIVLEALGGRRIENSEAWMSPRGPIERDPRQEKWFRISDERKTGRGAIDLVMLMDGKNFDEAVAWLLELNLPEIAASNISRDYEVTSLEKARERVESSLTRDPPTLAPVCLQPESGGPLLETVRHHLIEDKGLNSSFIDGLIACGEVGAVSFGQYTHAAFGRKSSDQSSPQCWRLLSLTDGREAVRGVAESYALRVNKGSGVAGRNDTVAVFTESSFDALAIGSAFKKGNIFPAFKTLIAIATNGIVFEELRRVVRQAAASARAIVAEFSRDFHGRTLAGHLTRAIREENVTPDNRGLTPIQFPPGCTRWIDILLRWREVVELEEKVIEAKNKRQRRSGPGIGD